MTVHELLVLVAGQRVYPCQYMWEKQLVKEFHQTRTYISTHQGSGQLIVAASCASSAKD